MMLDFVLYNNLREFCHNCTGNIVTEDVEVLLATVFGETQAKVKAKCSHICHVELKVNVFTISSVLASSLAAYINELLSGLVL